MRWMAITRIYLPTTALVDSLRSLSCSRGILFHSLTVPPQRNSANLRILNPCRTRAGVELHSGPAFYHAAADVYLMLIQHLDWRSKPNPGNLNMELAVGRGDGTEWTRPFRSHAGYPKFLDVNPTPGQFDSGTLWTNPHFVDGPNDTKRLFYGAYQQWDADTNPKDGNNTGVGMVEMTTDRFAYFTNLNASYAGQLTTKPFSVNGNVPYTWRFTLFPFHSSCSIPAAPVWLLADGIAWRRHLCNHGQCGYHTKWRSFDRNFLRKGTASMQYIGRLVSSRMQR